MFGDYEAQRHWMELTTALPLHQWYRSVTKIPTLLSVLPFTIGCTPFACVAEYVFTYTYLSFLRIITVDVHATVLLER